MRTHWLRGAALLAALAVTACGRGKIAAPDVAPEDTETRLGDKLDVSVADWLKRPRPELAKLADERAETITKQLEHARSNPDSVELLPNLLPPFTVPVFQQAKFSPKVGVSLPPYYKEGARDSALAIHLARYGDCEGARRLAGPADAATLARIDALKPSRNYPVEWSRLVGLTLLSAQLKLASGDAAGAGELAGIHKQLQIVLDKKVAAGPLGAALLPVGRRALAGAASAYREPKRNKTGLADDVEAALKEWGTTPAPVPALAIGAPSAKVATLFGVAPDGKAVCATTPAAVARALDLLGAPVTGEGVASVVAFLDGNGALAELLFAYRAKVETLYPEPAHLAHRLLEHGYLPPAGKQDVPGLLRQTYAGAGLAYEVSRVNRPSPFGAFVRIGAEKEVAPGPFARSGRDLGAVHLDRTFEANRVAVAPSKGGTVVTVSKKEDLAKLGKALGTPAPAGATLEREKSQDLVAAVRLSWSPDLNVDAPARLLPPLWSAFGAPRISGAEGHLTFSWEDDKTRLQLRLSFAEKAPVLVAEDRGAPAALPARAEAARKFDLAERAARFEAGAPHKRLRRELEVIEGLELGQARAEAELLLPPSSATVRKRAIPGGWAVLYANPPAADVTHWARELFVRFADDRVAEVRVRYEDGLAVGGPKKATLLQALEGGKHGKAEEVTAEWAGLWTDVGTGKPKPSKYRWQDDVTELTYQRDAGTTVEVVLRDRPAARPQGPALPPLQAVSRGVGPVKLGETQAEVRKAWTTPPGRAEEGADVYRLKADSAYAYVMIYYEAGKVSRLVAAHKKAPAPSEAGASAALQEAWQAGMHELGFVRRQVEKQGPVLERYFWHDEEVRVQSLVQATPEGPRLFTEWRTWPVPAEKRIAGR